MGRRRKRRRGRREWLKFTGFGLGRRVRKELQEMWREKQSIIAFSVKAEPDKTCVVDYR